MGRRLVGIGRYEEAEEYNAAAIAEDGGLPLSTRAWNRERYAELLMRLARYNEASQLLEEALRMTQQSVRPPQTAGWSESVYRHAACQHLVGRLSLYLSRFKDSEQQLRRLVDVAAPWVEQFPSMIWVTGYEVGSWRHDLAESLTALGRLDEAEQQRQLSLQAFELGASAVPATFSIGRGLAHYRWGELLHFTGRVEDARRQFIQAQAIMEDLARRRPDESVCHWQLICLLANCPDASFRDPQRAVALAKRVLPEAAGDYWRYLAMAQYRSGQWQAAVESIQRAMDLRRGGDAHDWLLLAMANWQLDQQAAALQWYARAQEAIKSKESVFYEYIGVLAFERLRREAATLLNDESQESAEGR